MKNRLQALILCCVLLPLSSFAQKTFQNPIIPGFHPDPSVIRVGEDYYLVNSSFEWFPGIPIYHSKDLVTWKLIGHALTRRLQLDMRSNRASSGVWAPTIRYHDGTYYVIVTCKQCGNNFYVTAAKPEGPYSDPVYLETPKGIDPSLFFDNGKVWFSANRFPEKPQYDGEHIIYVQEIDLNKGELIGERYDITAGMKYGVRATEGPHQYKVGDTYYLLTAEDMTWEKHMVVTYASKSPTGPYQLLPKNPALSHRDKPNSPIQHVGHADLVETQNGEWWAVVLGVRKIDRSYYLGRETFLVPVAWQDGAPVFNPGVGEVLMQDRRPNLPWSPWEQADPVDEFDQEKLGLEWNFLRTPQTTWWSLEEKGWLKISLRPEKSTEPTNPSLIAKRFQHFNFTATTKIDFEPLADNEEAGLIAIQNDRFQYRLIIAKAEGKNILKLVKVYNEKRKVLTENIVTMREYQGEKVLAVAVNGLDLQFMAGKSKNSLQKIGGIQDASVLSSHVAGGFTGAYVGMYASSNGRQSSNAAFFDWFEYKVTK